VNSADYVEYQIGRLLATKEQTFRIKAEGVDKSTKWLTISASALSAIKSILKIEAMADEDSTPCVGCGTDIPARSVIAVFEEYVCEPCAAEGAS
jgi:hypothetical protein